MATPAALEGDDSFLVSPESTAELSEENIDLYEGNEADLSNGGSKIGKKPESTAATRLQKVYRSYRTRRKLADSAVVAEELWWQALDFARLSYSTISFFNYSKPETAHSRWNRVSVNASKVGQGLSKDAKALKLAFQHWIEAIDPRHRYGHNLHFYYEKWCESDAGQPFFYWLDLGEGKNMDLEECPRSLLRKQCIKYLGPQERVQYQYILVGGRIIHLRTAKPLDTVNGPEGEKWIFVMCPSRRLYAGVKKKGLFHHSSFLAGGSTVAAGRFVAEDGVLQAIWAYSGHYKPTEENLDQLLNYLRINGVNLKEVQIHSSASEDYDDTKPTKAQPKQPSQISTISMPPPLQIPARTATDITNFAGTGAKAYKRSLSGGIQSPKADVPDKAIHDRIKSKMQSSSYQLGSQLSLKWCTGAGPRIGCVADYPVKLRTQALEFTDLSPRSDSPAHSRSLSLCLSPSPRVSRRSAG